MVKPEAIAAARDTIRWGIPPSPRIAQFVVESGNGLHMPGNNPFGMKPRTGMHDPYQLLKTTEYSKARGYYTVLQPFRTFLSLDAAFDAQAMMLGTSKTFAAARAALPDVDRFIELMASHYATDPSYAAKIKNVVHIYNLTQYDGGSHV